MVAVGVVVVVGTEIVAGLNNEIEEDNRGTCCSSCTAGIPERVSSGRRCWCKLADLEVTKPPAGGPELSPPPAPAACVMVVRRFSGSEGSSRNCQIKLRVKFSNGRKSILSVRSCKNFYFHQSMYESNDEGGRKWCEVLPIWCRC